MSKKVIVLGAGLIGKPLTMDLAKDDNFEVGIADINWNILETIDNPRIAKRHIDLSRRTELKKAIREFDLVVNAVPGFMGFQTLKSVIEAGKDCVDIAFYPKMCWILKHLLRKKEFG